MSLRLLAALLCAALPCLSATAQGHAPKTPPAPAEKQDKVQYVIAQVGNDLQVVAKSEVDALKKQMADKQKQAMAAFNREKAAAAAAHKKFDQKPPKEVTVTLKPGTYASKDAADAALQKLQAAEHGGEKPKAPPQGGGHGGGHGG